MIESLTTDEDGYVRFGLGIGIGLIYRRTGGKKALDIFKRLIRTGDRALREGAGIGMGLAFQGTGNHEAINLLRNLIIDEEDEYVKSDVAIGLGLILQKKETIEKTPLGILIFGTSNVLYSEFYPLYLIFL